jgi:hypothetical protein
MAHAISRRPLTAEARIRSQVSQPQRCVDKEVLGRVFLLVFRCAPVSIIPHFLVLDFHTHIALTQRTDGRILRTFHKSNALKKSVYFFFNGFSVGLHSRNAALHTDRTSQRHAMLKHAFLCFIIPTRMNQVFRSENVLQFLTLFH